MEKNTKCREKKKSSITITIIKLESKIGEFQHTYKKLRKIDNWQ